MTDQLTPADRVLVTIHQKLALLRVEGRGSFKSSLAVREFGISAIASGCNTIVLDMTACVGLDSTFMGTLAGLASRLHEHGRQRGDMILLNLNPRVRGLVATLGLDRLAMTYEQGATPEDMQNILALSENLRALDTPENSRDATTRMMIEAHENLTSLISDNIPRFKDVLTYLREDLNRNSPPGR